MRLPCQLTEGAAGILGGKSLVERPPGEGTIIRVVLPLTLKDG